MSGTEIPKGTAPPPSPPSDEKETNVNSASDSSSADDGKLSSSSKKDNQEQPSSKEPSTSTDSDDDGPLLQWMTGIKEDLSVRLPLYVDDWSRPKSIFTVVNATFLPWSFN